MQNANEQSSTNNDETEEQNSTSEDSNTYPTTIVQDSERYDTPATHSQPKTTNTDTTTDSPASQHPHNHQQQQPEAIPAGQLVLQWLTYAFWGWTVLALSALTTSVIASFVADADTGGFTPYGIAAILVLLPISYVTDYYYSKKEQPKKTGVSIAIMVIHAVIFALIGIGSLILAMFMVVQMLTDGSDNTPAQITLYSSLIIFVYYVATFLRTLNPAKFPVIKKFYKIFMLGTIGFIAILGIVGPVAKERSMRQDKLVSSNLYSVNSAIQDYTKNNKRQPDSLNDITVSGDAKKIIDKDLVTYKPEGIDYSYSGSTSTRSNATKYKYQLCVTYDHESRNYGKSSRYGLNDAGNDKYNSYLSSSSHPSGEVCYKQLTTVY